MYGLNWEGDEVESKYRVGDRVRVVKDGHEDGGSCHGAKIGSAATITYVESGDDKIWYTTNIGWGFYPHEIAPAFQPGDRVRLNKHRDLHACGDRGTVKRVFGDSVEVRMDLSALGSRFFVFPAEHLDWVRDETAPDCAERRVEQDNEPAQGKPKFKVGDVVTYAGDNSIRNVIKCVKTNYSDGLPFRSDRVAYDYEGNGWDFESSLVLAANTHCIVSRVINGQPAPSALPHVHADVAAASTEAERLARANPGTEFAVYQRVAGRLAEVSYEMKEVA